jgi:hypothetical protein
MSSDKPEIWLFNRDAQGENERDDDSVSFSGTEVGDVEEVYTESFTFQDHINLNLANFLAITPVECVPVRNDTSGRYYLRFGRMYFFANEWNPRAFQNVH